MAVANWNQPNIYPFVVTYKIVLNNFIDAFADSRNKAIITGRYWIKLLNAVADELTFGTEVDGAFGIYLGLLLIPEIGRCHKKIS